MGRVFEGREFLLIFLASFCIETHSNGIIEWLLPDCILGEDSVDFYFYSRKIRNGVVVDVESNAIPLDSHLLTMFLVHGFISQADSSQYLKLINTMRDKRNVNVFAVNWKEGSCTTGGIYITKILGYPSAVGNTRVVGEKMSRHVETSLKNARSDVINSVQRFIGRLIRDYGMELQKMILIGHSLGAHIVGFAGKDVQKQGTGRIPHIVALDPAGPGFEDNSCDGRICSSDADFVQVFHTSFFFGIHRAVGNSDFYFNGGVNQPDCPLLNIPECSHGKAVDYLNDILQNPNCGFIGKQWDRSFFLTPQLDCTVQTCSVPGPMAPDLPARGTFYVDTGDVSSFCNDRS